MPAFDMSRIRIVFAFALPILRGVFCWNRVDFVLKLCETWKRWLDGRFLTFLTGLSGDLSSDFTIPDYCTAPAWEASL